MIDRKTLTIILIVLIGIVIVYVAGWVMNYGQDNGWWVLPTATNLTGKI